MQLKLQSSLIYVASSPVDFRRGIDGLGEYVSNIGDKLLTTSLFVFHNKGKDKIKLLFWHNNGFVLIQKRLEKKKFIFICTDNHIQITDKQLSWLLAGLDWQAMSNWKELSYDDYY